MHIRQANNFVSQYGIDKNLFRDLRCARMRRKKFSIEMNSSTVDRLDTLVNQGVFRSRVALINKIVEIQLGIVNGELAENITRLINGSESELPASSRNARRQQAHA